MSEAHEAEALATLRALLATPPVLTELELTEVLYTHAPRLEGRRICVLCGVDWPCPTVRLAEEVHRLRQTAT